MGNTSSQIDPVQQSQALSSSAPASLRPDKDSQAQSSPVREVLEADIEDQHLSLRSRAYADPPIWSPLNNVVEHPITMASSLTEDIESMPPPSKRKRENYEGEVSKRARKGQKGRSRNSEALGAVGIGEQRSFATRVPVSSSYGAANSSVSQTPAKLSKWERKRRRSSWSARKDQSRSSSISVQQSPFTSHLINDLNVVIQERPSDDSPLVNRHVRNDTIEPHRHSFLQSSPPLFQQLGSSIPMVDESLPPSSKKKRKKKRKSRRLSAISNQDDALLANDSVPGLNYASDRTTSAHAQAVNGASVFDETRILKPMTKAETRNRSIGVAELTNANGLSQNFKSAMIKHLQNLEAKEEHAQDRATSTEGQAHSSIDRRQNSSQVKGDPVKCAEMGFGQEQPDIVAEKATLALEPEDQRDDSPYASSSEASIVEIQPKAASARVQQEDTVSERDEAQFLPSDNDEVFDESVQSVQQDPSDKAESVMGSQESKADADGEDDNANSTSSQELVEEPQSDEEPRGSSDSIVTDTQEEESAPDDRYVEYSHTIGKADRSQTAPLLEPQNEDRNKDKTTKNIEAQFNTDASKITKHKEKSPKKNGSATKKYKSTIRVIDSEDENVDVGSEQSISLTGDGFGDEDDVSVTVSSRPLVKGPRRLPTKDVKVQRRSAPATPKMRDISEKTPGKLINGPFDNDEIAIVERFRDERPPEEAPFVDMVNKNATSGGLEVRKFWSEMESEFNGTRNRKALQRFCRRRWPQATARTQFTAEDDEELIRLAESFTQGKRSWVKIAEEMNRIPDEVRDRYRNVLEHRETRNTNRWSGSELTALRHAVGTVAAKALTSLTAESGKRAQSNKDLESLIIWGSVSDELKGIRGRTQCSYMWSKLRARGEVSLAQEIKAAKKRLGLDLDVSSLDLADMSMMFAQNTTNGAADDDSVIESSTPANGKNPTARMMATSKAASKVKRSGNPIPSKADLNDTPSKQPARTATGTAQTNLVATPKLKDRLQDLQPKQSNWIQSRLNLASAPKPTLPVDKDISSESSESDDDSINMFSQMATTRQPQGRANEAPSHPTLHTAAELDQAEAGVKREDSWSGDESGDDALQSKPDIKSSSPIAKSNGFFDEEASETSNDEESDEEPDEDDVESDGGEELSEESD